MSMHELRIAQSTIRELRAEASALKIKHYGRMKKADLIDAIVAKSRRAEEPIDFFKSSTNADAA